MKRNFFYFINDWKINRILESNVFVGEKKIFLSHDDDLTKDTKWSNIGFEVIKVFSNSELEFVRKKILSIFSKQTKLNTLAPVSNLNFLKNLSDLDYLKLINETCYNTLTPIDIGLDLNNFTKKISDILGFEVELNKFEKKNKTVQLRVVRPNQLDFNPPHRDIYIEHLKNAINLYVPIFGCIKNSSLPLLPGSHKWSDDMTIRTDTNCVVDSRKYNVPCIFSTSDNKPLKLKRPILNYGEAMMFSPYMIHGGAANKGADTRLSIELRFYRK